jgi:DNA-nicking Smr family endonuclease
MKLKDILSSDDKKLFKNAVTKVKPMVNDTIHPVKRSIKPKSTIANKKQAHQQASFFFSDQFEPNLPQQGPVSYVRQGSDSYAAKSLRRGQYVPDLILDLHGLDQHNAKLEIAALLHACQKEHAQCVCIVHGLGARILKNKVPHWLVQHPDVIAFHQATLEWGGNGALLVLIDLHDKQ